MLDSKHIRTREIINNLKSGKESLVLSSIEEIREHGNADILPTLISLFFSDNSNECRLSALRVLNDLKDPLSVPVIAEALNTFRGKSGFHSLVASCWQNGLDFSPYLNLFADLMISEDLQVAIEAYSVIEENVHLLDNKARTDLIQYIRSAKIPSTDECKSNLILELINMLEEWDHFQ